MFYCSQLKMFQKPFRIKTNTPLKSSERKKIHQQLSSTFFEQLGENNEVVSELFSKSHEVSCAKIYTHGGDDVNIYLVDKIPLVFHINKKAPGDVAPTVSYLPTIFLLWKLPELVKVFVTHNDVLKKLQGGADLMLPGVIHRTTEITPATFQPLVRGTPVAVALRSNRAPIGVGVAAHCAEDLYMCAGRGKAVLIWHVLGDYLCRMVPNADSVLPPELGPFELTSQDESASEEENSEEENLVETVAKVSLESEVVEDAVEDVSETESEEDVSCMEDDMVFALLKALKTTATAKKLDLPILTSLFFRQHMVPAATTAGLTLDVKRSKWKKLTNFLKEMTDNALLKVSQLSKGVDSITEVNYDHPDILAFRVPPPVQELVTQEVDPLAYIPPEITELYNVTAAVLPILKPIAKGAFLTSPEVRAAVTEYVRREGLQNTERKQIVKLDPVLASVAMSKGDPPSKVEMTWAEVMSRTLQKMTPAYRIAFEGKPPIERKGSVPNVNVSIEKRMGNKKVTVVSGVSGLGLDANLLAKQIQHGVATSASLSGREESTGPTITVLGDQRKYLRELFLVKYQIPQKLIKGLEQVPKAKGGKKK